MTADQLNADLHVAIGTELQRVEEDCIHSSKSHFNAHERWARYHYWLGIPAVIISSFAGLAFFKENPSIGGLLSVLVAVLTALSTFLKPFERAASHKSSGDQYLALRNDARVFREIKLTSVCDAQSAVDGLLELTKRRNDLNQASPQFSSKDFTLARLGIESGEATHKADQST